MKPDQRSAAESAGNQPAPDSRTWTFPDETQSVSMGRRALLETLGEWGMQYLGSSAGLVVTELAANAVLHANGPFEVRAERLERGVRISVADSSPQLPVIPTLSTSSMTGRGLLLVRSLAAKLGFQPRPGGKVVWAEVRHDLLPGDAGMGELIDAWADDLGGEAMADPTVHRVELGEVPTDLLLAAKSHVDNLVREFMLAAAGAEDGSGAAVPPHLAELIEAVVNRFSGPRLSIKRQALDAARRGLDHVRLRLDVEPGGAEAGEAYLAALDEVDVYCRAARLLTLETPPKHRVFRHWYVGEIISQLRRTEAGLPPEPAQPFEDRLLEEIDAVAGAWATAERAARLFAVTAALSGAMTPEAVAEAVLGEGVKALGASGGGLFVPSGRDRLTLPGTVGYNAALVQSLRSESAAAELPAAVALRTGEPVWIESRDERDERFPELVSMEAETISMCAVPLRIDDRLLGALRFSFREQRIFGEEERRFVLALASIAAQALDRTQLHQERTRLYERLQHSLLPPALPVIPGLDLAAVYHPLGDGIDVGGDFYDVWQTGEQEWAFALGDVCGTGPEAAGLSACVRYTLRGIATPGADARVLLERLNEVLLASTAEEPERFCTVLFGTVRPAPDGFLVRLATGGHPEPLLQRGDGTVEPLPTGGSLLGILPSVTVGQRELHMVPGDRLFVYSDGVSEARRVGQMLDTGGLADIVGRAPADAAGAAGWIESKVLDWSGGRLQDDLAVLVLQVGS